MVLRMHLKAHLTMYTACLDDERLCILLTECTCRSYAIFGLINNYFRTHIQHIVLIKGRCLYCNVETEILNTLHINFRFRSVRSYQIKRFMVL